MVVFWFADQPQACGGMYIADDGERASWMCTIQSSPQSSHLRLSFRPHLFKYRKWTQKESSVYWPQVLVLIDCRCCFSFIFFPSHILTINTDVLIPDTALRQKGDWQPDNSGWWQSICVSLRPPGLRVSVDTKWEWQRKDCCDPGVITSAPCCTKKVY